MAHNFIIPLTLGINVLHQEKCAILAKMGQILKIGKMCSTWTNLPYLNKCATGGKM